MNPFGFSTAILALICLPKLLEIGTPSYLTSEHFLPKLKTWAFGNGMQRKAAIKLKAVITNLRVLRIEKSETAILLVKCTFCTWATKFSEGKLRKLLSSKCRLCKLI
jgi:hypothetical protein